MLTPEDELPQKYGIWNNSEKRLVVVRKVRFKNVQQV